MKHQINIVLAAATLIVASDGFAQSDMQTPSFQASRGQSQAQQSRDMDRCSMQARKQTGVDPISIAANATPLQQGKGITSVPIEAPSTAMGASAAGTTAAGSGMSASGQMSNSGQVNNAGSAQMETGAGQPATSSSAQMSNANNGQMASSSNGQMGSSSTAQTGTATSNSDWATGNRSSANMPSSAGTSSSANMPGSAGTSSSGSSASGSSGSSGNTMAMADSADAYNQAFSNCMTGRGYVVGSNNQ